MTGIAVAREPVLTVSWLMRNADAILASLTELAITMRRTRPVGAGDETEGKQKTGHHSITSLLTNMPHDAFTS